MERPNDYRCFGIGATYPVVYCYVPNIFPRFLFLLFFSLLVFGFFSTSSSLYSSHSRTLCPIARADGHVVPTNFILTCSYTLIPSHRSLRRSGRCDANLILEEGTVRGRREEGKITDHSPIKSFIYSFFLLQLLFIYPFSPCDDGRRLASTRIALAPARSGASDVLSSAQLGSSTHVK